MNVYKGRMPTKIELTLEQSQQGVSNDVLVSIEGVEELKRNVWIKGSKERSPPHNLGRNRVNTYAVRITMLIADIEDDIMDPVMQCTTLLSHSGFSQQKLVSFVTEIHMTSIDFLTPIHKLLTRVLRIILVILPEHPSDTYVLTMKMEILLEPASNKLLVGDLRDSI
ncbi:hypothetical protein Tco_1379176 [Tanacetum coccineum]